MKIHSQSEIHNVAVQIVRKLLRAPEGMEVFTVEILKQLGYSMKYVDTELFLLISSEIHPVSARYGLLLDPGRYYFREENGSVRPFVMSFTVHHLGESGAGTDGSACFYMDIQAKV